jgi:hypothetical protein
MQGQTMPSAHHQRLISFANYLLSLLLGLTLLAADGHTQETENTAAQSDPQQSESQASSSVSSEAPPYESRAMRDRTLIANALQDESLWLDTEYGKILAMHRITEAKSTLGVLLLLHAAEDPQHWPPALENVRANLPRYGWETLALAVPPKIAPPIPGRPSSSSSSQSDESSDEKNTNEPSSPDAAPAASASSSSSSSSSSSVPREQLIAAYIDAALNYLKGKNQFNVVVLTDNSSAYPSLQKLLPMINDNPKDPKTIDGPLQALIIINLQQQEPLNREELESIFDSKQLPVMDIFFTPDDAAQQTARNLHRAVAMRKKLDDYQQLQINNQPTITETDFQSFLLGRVRGFMQKKASGIELKKEDEKTPGTIN